MKSPAILAKSISSCIGKDNILNDVSFEIPKASLTSILGPSGSGKTTLLKTIAGFQPICKGELFIKSSLVSKRNFTLRPDKRNIGMVFQDHALFPHLSVLDNIKTGLKSNSSDPNQVNRLIEKLHLSHLKNRHPHEISSGQQQRTALARALVAQPEIILFDEPFANLNQDLQIEVGIELVDIIRQQKLTAIMVTHDQSDAMAISDYIVMLKKGYNLQSGAPETLYYKPATRQVASFLSRGSFIKAYFLKENKAKTHLGTVDINLSQNINLKTGDQIDIWLHPEDIIIDTNHGREVEVTQQSWRPLDLLIKIRTNENEDLLLKADQQLKLNGTEKIKVRLNNRIRYSAFA